jgi:DNA-directed RNA polymerase specialized sigma subunit
MQRGDERNQKFVELYLECKAQPEIVEEMSISRRHVGRITENGQKHIL